MYFSLELDNLILKFIMSEGSTNLKTSLKKKQASKLALLDINSHYKTIIFKSVSLAYGSTNRPMEQNRDTGRAGKDGLFNNVLKQFVIKMASIKLYPYFTLYK